MLNYLIWGRAQSDPGNAGWQRDLAVSHERIGDMERRLDHTSEAGAAFKRALAVYDSLLAANPENTQFLVFSTVPLMRLGELDPDRQKTYFERALKILKDLDAAGRLEPRRRDSIAWLESRLGPVMRGGQSGASPPPATPPTSAPTTLPPPRD